MLPVASATLILIHLTAFLYQLWCEDSHRLSEFFILMLSGFPAAHSIVFLHLNFYPNATLVQLKNVIQLSSSRYLTIKEYNEETKDRRTEEDKEERNLEFLVQKESRAY